MVGNLDYLPKGTNPQCGIYMIKNTRNGKKYIGSTKNAFGRSTNHFKELRGNRHHCDKLQNAWNKENDPSIFKFIMFIFCKKEELEEYEQACFDHMKPEYNSSLLAYRVDFTPTVIKKMSVKRRARITKPTTKVKTSLSLLGKSKSSTHAENISRGRKGIVFSEGHIANLRAARQERAKREMLVYWGA